MAAERSHARRRARGEPPRTLRPTVGVEDALPQVGPWARPPAGVHLHGSDVAAVEWERPAYVVRDRSAHVERSRSAYVGRHRQHVDLPPAGQVLSTAPGTPTVPRTVWRLRTLRIIGSKAVVTGERNHVRVRHSYRIRVAGAQP
jgi:hypothetical protein